MATDFAQREEILETITAILEKHTDYDSDFTEDLDLMIDLDMNELVIAEFAVELDQNYETSAIILASDQWLTIGNVIDTIIDTI